MRAKAPTRPVPSPSDPHPGRDASPARPTAYPSPVSHFARSLRRLAVHLHAGSSPVIACPGWSGQVDWRLHGWVLSHPVPQGTAAPNHPGSTAGPKTLLRCFPNPSSFLPPGPLHPQLSTLPSPPHPPTPPGSAGTGCPPASMRPAWRPDPRTARPMTSRPTTRKIPAARPSPARSRSREPTRCSRPDRTSR